jgi:hypothetical protein
LLLAVGILASFAAAGPAFAVAYTFTDSNGDPYCDGITLNESGGVATGHHTGCTDKDYAGGLSGKISILDATAWVVTTTDALNDSGVTLVYVIDQVHFAWYLYAQETGVETFNFINEGLLAKGAPIANEPGPHGRVASDTVRN